MNNNSDNKEQESDLHNEEQTSIIAEPKNDDLLKNSIELAIETAMKSVIETDDVVPENILNLKKQIAESGVFNVYKKKVNKTLMDNMEIEEKYMDDSDIEDEMKIHSPIKNKQIDETEQITTNGIKMSSMEYKHLQPPVKTKLSMCDFCGTSYKQDMIVECNGDLNCMHCFFWSHYHIERRPEADGIYGPTIVDYILKCRADHDIYNCSNSFYTGCCFICDHFAGEDLMGVKDTNRLLSTTENYINQEDDLNDDDVLIIEL